MTEAGLGVLPLINHASEYLRRASTAASHDDDERLRERMEHAYNLVCAALVILGAHVAKAKVTDNA